MTHRAHSIVEADKAKLASIIDRLVLYDEAKGDAAPQLVELPESSAIETVVRRLPAAAAALRVRWGQRLPLTIVDEYDVQYIVHALLRVFFDDVRPEEHVPSYAGTSSRMDFFVPAVETVLEIKMMRDCLTAAKLRNELIVDAAQYQKHPGCRRLFCMVYDPTGAIPTHAAWKVTCQARTASWKSS
jgi:hypothetical protein